MIIPHKRFAAIDIGTNSFHLIIVEVTETGDLKLLDRERVFLRLGSEFGEDLSFISDNEIEKAIVVLKRFSSLANHYKASIRAVSTSAVRESKNKLEFINTMFEQTGIKVETIEGPEEANLIFLGMKNALPLNDKSVLCIDIGGGSTEFIYGVNGKSVFAESVKIGAVRLSKKFFPDYIITDSAIKQCSDYVEQLIEVNPNIKTDLNIDFAVGSSGTIDTICMIKRAKSKNKINTRLNGYEFDKSDLDEIYNYVMKLKTPAQRTNVKGIEAKRADIIPAGFIIIKKVFEIFNIKKMVLSEYALREGVVFDFLSKNS